MHITLYILVVLFPACLSLEDERSEDDSGAYYYDDKDTMSTMERIPHPDTQSTIGKPGNSTDEVILALKQIFSGRDIEEFRLTTNTEQQFKEIDHINFMEQLTEKDQETQSKITTHELRTDKGTENERKYTKDELKEKLFGKEHFRYWVDKKVPKYLEYLAKLDAGEKSSSVKTKQKEKLYPSAYLEASLVPGREEQRGNVKSTYFGKSNINSYHTSAKSTSKDQHIDEERIESHSKYVESLKSKESKTAKENKKKNIKGWLDKSRESYKETKNVPILVHDEKKQSLRCGQNEFYWSCSRCRFYSDACEHKKWIHWDCEDYPWYWFSNCLERCICKDKYHRSKLSGKCVPPDQCPVKPRIDRTNLKKLVVRAGEPIFYDVNVTGLPVPKVQWWNWTTKWEKVTENVINVDYNTKLNITKAVRTKPILWYGIEAKNGYATDWTYWQIIVISEPGTPGGPLYVSDITNSSCKLGWKKPNDDGGKKILHYEVEKLNKAENRWVLVGKTTNTKIEIKDLEELTEYEFRVRAVNELGGSKPELNTKNSTLTKGKPRIDRTNLKALEVGAGERISFDVNVAGEPAPKIRWFKKWKNEQNEVTENVKTVIHNTKLDIKESVRANTGTYRIVATNRYGRDEAAVEITVFSVPGTPGGPLQVSDVTNSSCKLTWNESEDDGGKTAHYEVEKLNKAENRWVSVGKTDNTEMEIKDLEEFTEYEFRVRAVNELGGSKPELKTKDSTFTEGKPRIDRTNLKALEVRAGERISFDVNVKGDPAPEVEWFKTWKNRENKVTENVNKVGHNTKLDIKESVRAMTGTYRIVATNRYGKDEAAVEITVFSAPGTPGGPLNVSDITNRSCKLAWNKIEDDGGKTAHYEVEKLNKAENRWVLVGKTDNTEMEIKGLEELTEYEFRVKAVNEIGISTLKPKNSTFTEGKPRIDRTNLKALFVRAGKPIFFDANVKGVPVPKVEWFKTWKNEEKKVTENVINVDHNTKLDIKESVRAMTGTYRIVATNRYGKDEAAFEIAVLLEPGAPGGPLIVSHITNSSCKLTWNKPEDDGGKAVHYKVEKLIKAENRWLSVGETDNTEMEIKDLEELKEYEFRVKAVNEIGGSKLSLKTENSISTEGKPRIDRTNLKALEVRAGERISLDVNVAGEPAPKVKWFKTWKNRENEVTENLNNVDHNTKLDIKESVREMTGTYRIVATNRYGKDEADVKITVFSVPDTPGGPLNVSDITNSSCKLAWNKVEDDGDKTVHYEVEKLNKAENRWVSVGKTDNTKMEIKDLEELTEYEFRVKAVNEVGGSKLSLKTENSTITQGKPRIDRTNLKAVEVRAGERISFDVKVTGEPAPKVKWFKKWKNVENEVTENVNNVDHNTKLDIKESVRAMTGTYRIVATNRYGKDEAAVEITVFSVPGTPGGPLNVSDITSSSCKLTWNKPEDDGGKTVHYEVEKLNKAENRWIPVGKTDNTEMEIKGLEEFSEYEFKVKAVNEIGFSTLKTEYSIFTRGKPRIDRTNLKALEVREGERISFDVKVMGEPAPKVKWFKKWKNVENEVTENVINVDHNTKLDIKESVRAMTGTYRIVATNLYGKDEAAVEITVFSVPGTPGGPLNVSHITNSSCKLAWNKPEFDGGKTVHYEVEKLEKTKNRWIPVEKTDNTEMEIKGLEELTEYEFRVKAVNEIGESKLSLKTKNSTITQGKPRIDRTNLKALQVRAGERIFLDVNVPGDPAPKVKWFKKWKNVENEVTENVINVDHNTKLDIKESVRAMTGTYRIVATNLYGKDEAAVEITVFLGPGVPGGPLIVSQITNSSCKLTWNKPEDDGGKPVHYKVEKLIKAENRWIPVGKTDNTEMEIKDLEELTEYEFRVKAVNEIGGSELGLETENSISTEGKPRIDRTNLKALEVRAGERISLDVNVAGTPAPKVKWFKTWKNGENEVTENLNNVDHNTKLDIKESVRAMTGTYRIVATNHYGKDEANVKITVFSVPDTPGGPLNVSDITNSSCKLAWNKPEDDGDKTVHYEVEKLNKAENRWVSVGKTDNTEMEIKDLEELTEYEFRVTAVNEVGGSKLSLKTENGTITQGKPRIDRTNLKALEVRAGERISLDVNVAGDPVPEVKWFKKWKNEENEVTENVNNVDHNTKLDIKESVRAMTGTYRIVATNRYGKDEAAVEITVFTVPGTPGGPLNVSDITNSSCKLTWNKPEDDGGKTVHYEVEKLDKTKNHWIPVEKTDNTEMEIKGLEELTEYEFRVKAVNEMGISTLKTEYSIFTRGKPRIDRTNLKALEVRAGERISFDVNVAGEPAPKVNWFKKWKNGENEVTENVNNVDHNTKLDIKESVRAMTGTYRIVATNLYGKDEAAVEITVFSVPGTPGGPLNVTDIANSTCKLTWNKPEDDGGKTVHYEVEKLNKAENRWVSVGKTDNTEMEIKDLEEFTEYEFRVKAVNEIGFSTLKTEYSIYTRGKPRIDRTNLKAVEVREGERISLDVKVAGEPAPKVKWFKKWKNGENEVTENVNNVDHNTKLDIKESVRAMTGTYRIVATNRYGKDEADVEITVFSVPGTPRGPLNVSHITNSSCKLAWNKPEYDGGKTVHYEVEKLNKAENRWIPVGKTDSAEMEIKDLEELTEYEFRVKAVNEVGGSKLSLKTENSTITQGKPRIDRTNLKAVEVREGERISFDVNVAGEPAPKVEWFKTWKNREKKVTENVINVDHNTKLDIKESVRAMTGTYRIVATNRYGKDEAAVEITVFSVPGTPGGPLNVSDITNSSCKLAWNKPKDDGGKTVLYEVEKLSKAENLWVPVGETKNTKLEVKDLEELTEYEFRVKAVNEMGQSKLLKTENSRFTEGKPRIDRTNLKAVKVREGERISLDVKVAGEPAPKVKWFKKWKNGENEVTENVINVDHNTKLDIEESVRAMTGTYRIVAKNRYGKDEAAVDVTVFSVPDTPGGPLNVSHITNCSCKLAWNKPKDDGGKTVHYKVEKLDKTKNRWIPVGNTDNTEMEIKGLQELTEYEFRVKAVNEIGESKLGLKKSIRTDQKPRIDRTRLKAKSVVAGEPIYFDVNVKGFPNPKVEWFQTWKNKRKRVTKNIFTVGNHTTLNIEKSVRAMTGVYRILADNRYGKDEVDVEITVLSVPDIPGGPLDVSDCKRWTCKLAWNVPKDDGGKPVTHYEVEKFKKDIGVWKAGVSTPATKTTIRGLESGEEYYFRVRAVNEIGKSKALVTEHSYSTVAKPSIDRTNLKARVVTAGERIYIDVKVKGFPVPDVQWFKKGKDEDKEIDDDEKLNLLKQLTENVITKGRNTILDIKEPVRAMTGTYRIVANNIYGTDEASVEITVLSTPDQPGGPLKVFDIMTRSCKLSWKKPKEDGGKPVRRYVVEAFIKAEGRWVRVGQTTDTKMQIKGLQEGHEYDFRVAAINDVGSSPKLKTGHSYFTKSKPRIDRTSLNTLQVRAGEPISFVVNVQGEPEPEKQWFFNNWKNGEKKLTRAGAQAELRTSAQNMLRTALVTNDRHTTKLYIKNSVRALTGTYRLWAHNIFGTDEARVTVIVASVPNKPGGPLEVSDITKASCKLAWKEPDDDGGKPVTHYEVEIKSNTTGEWEFVGQTLETKMMIKSLIQGETYELRVKAFNELGPSDPLKADRSIIAKNPHETGDIVSRCYVCGLFDPGIPYNAHCGDAFAHNILSLISEDATAREYIDEYKKDCKWMESQNKSFYYNESEPNAVWGEFTGGCAVRWIDLSEVYTQRTCRNRNRPMMGKHYVSKRMAKLELALQGKTEGCVFSPVASLVPFSRGVSLYARFHACVCKGHYCNRSPRSQNSIFLIFMLTFIILMRMSSFLDAVV